MCVATVAVWVRTAGVYPLQARFTTVGPCWVRSAKGQIEVIWLKDSARRFVYWQYSSTAAPDRLADACRWRALGFGFDVPRPKNGNYRIVVPLRLLRRQWFWRRVIGC